MNEAKLKACPFCGGDAESDMTQGFRRMMDGVISKAVAIYCLKCSAQITMCHDDHKEYAPEDMLTILTDAWNIRAGDQQPETMPAEKAIAGSLQRPGSTTDRTLALAQDFCERTITDLNSAKATLRYETLEAFEKLCTQCGISTTRIQS